jgi:hypothetical protein
VSLYCAASVFIYLYLEQQASRHVDDLNFIVSAMESISRNHAITRANLRQLIVDVERNGLTGLVRTPKVADSGGLDSAMSTLVPLLARSKISRLSKGSPLPGLLPVNQVADSLSPDKPQASIPVSWASRPSANPSLTQWPDTANKVARGKRRRTSQSTGTGPWNSSPENNEPVWQGNNVQGPSETIAMPALTNPGVRLDPSAQASPTFAHMFGSPQNGQSPPKTLPHRTATPSFSPKTSVDVPSLSAGLDPTVFIGTGGNPAFPQPHQAPTGPDRVDDRLEVWDSSVECLYEGGFTPDANNPGQWAQSGEGGDVDWNAMAARAGVPLGWDDNTNR